MDHETDQVLLRACRRGDEAAARALYARLAPTLIAFARTILRDEARAEDALQSAFCRIFRAGTWEVDRVENVRAWMAQIVRRVALTMLRTEKRLAQRNRRHEEERERAASLERRSPAASASFTSELGELRRLIDELPRLLAEVVILKHVAALTFDQIAVALDMNRNTAASRYRDAMQQLRAALAVQGTGRKESPHVR